ncbi:MAG: hypothetical protein MUE42_09740 [Opitutaceae bacterium]|jgi:hypothetical protein|nr:hypothetical protein [Opitutaceae bacterium]
MNLVVHFVRKDRERMRLPLVAWYALIAGKAWWVWQLMRSSDVELNLATLESVVGVLNGIEAVAGALLALQMAFEDKPWGPTAFAATRPITRGQLLLAKAGGSLLLFVVGPLLLLTPVWLASGFSPGDLGLAAADWALVQGLFVAFGLLAGAVARDGGQVMVAAPMLGGAALGVAVYLRREPAPPMWLSAVLALGVAAIGILAAYRSRRRMIVLAVVTLGLLCVAGMGLPTSPERFDMPPWPEADRPLGKGETRITGAHRWMLVGTDNNGKGRWVLIAQSARPSYPILDTLRTSSPPRAVALCVSASTESGESPPLAPPLRVGTVRAASLSVTRWELGLSGPSPGHAEEWRTLSDAVLRLEPSPGTAIP